MFCFPLRWRKASRCKKLIRRVRRRLRLLKTRRVSIIKQLREDITTLFLTDVSPHHQPASPLVEQLVHSEGLLAAYDLLDQFCELIITRLSYIRKNKECPNDINEAVSSLIFASSRCGDLPELWEIRKLFGAWYGKKFATVALELLPGNLVNWKVMEKLSVKCVREDEKKRFLEEMAINYGVQTLPLSFDFSSEPQIKQEEEEEEEEKIVEMGRESEDNRHEYSEDSKVLIPYTNKTQADELEGFMFPLRESTILEDQRVFLFKTPLSSSTPPFLHGSTNDDEAKGCPEKRRLRRSSRRRGRSRRKGISGVIDMQSSLYYHTCYYQRRRMQQKRNPLISNGKLGYVLAVVASLSEKMELQSLNLCYNEQKKKKEGGRGGCGEIAKAECNGGGRLGGSPSYVHPKLPNWEEFHARFVALRRAHLNS